MEIFSIKHVISIIVIVGAAIVLATKMSRGKKGFDKRVLLVSGLVMVGLELVRMFISMEDYGGGKYYLPASLLPFHLCALQIFLIFILYFVKGERIQRAMIAFMYPTMLCGAVVSLLMPADSGMKEFDSILSYQFMISHGILLFLSIYMYMSRAIKFSARTYGIAVSGLMMGLVLAVYLNTLAGGAESGVNFFYIVEPPMEGMPILNMNQGWHMYIVKLSLTTLVMLTCSYIPVIIKWFKLRKIKEANANTILYETNKEQVDFFK
jgi:hypothetical integral membrane protein (TIGR02206 family)